MEKRVLTTVDNANSAVTGLGLPHGCLAARLTTTSAEKLGTTAHGWLLSLCKARRMANASFIGCF
jgi:hypothetical protein